MMSTSSRNPVPVDVDVVLDGDVEVGAHRVDQPVGPLVLVLEVEGGVDLRVEVAGIVDDLHPEVPRDGQQARRTIGRLDPEQHDRVGQALTGLVLPVGQDRVVGVDPADVVGADDQEVLGRTSRAQRLVAGLGALEDLVGRHLVGTLALRVRVEDDVDAVDAGQHAGDVAEHGGTGDQHDRERGEAGDRQALAPGPARSGHRGRNLPAGPRTWASAGASPTIAASDSNQRRPGRSIGTRRGAAPRASTMRSSS